MKTLILNGSPRKNGDSMAIISRMCEFLQGEVKIISAYDLNISACTDCRYCREHQKCAIKDDMQEVYEYLEAADNLIISSPIHLCSLSAPLLALLSRLHCLHRHYQNPAPDMKKKNGVYILTGGDNIFQGYKIGEESSFSVEANEASPAAEKVSTLSDTVRLAGGLVKSFNELGIDTTRHLEPLLHIIFKRLNTRRVGWITNFSTSFTPAAENPRTMSEAKSMAELLNRFYDEQVKKEEMKKEKPQRLLSRATDEKAQKVKIHPEKPVGRQEPEKRVFVKKETGGMVQKERARMEKEAEKERKRCEKKRGL